MGEKFQVNGASGTGSLSIPISTSAGREGLGPSIGLSYNSGSGNGPFGLGWSMSVPSITRKTSKGLPKYLDEQESDVFLFNGAEDLVPLLRTAEDGELVFDKTSGDPIVHLEHREGFSIQRYALRVEQSFARIERWTGTSASKVGEIHWRVIGPNNSTSIFGRDANSRIESLEVSSEGPKRRIFSWLLAETYDSQGNAVIYEYKAEDYVDVPVEDSNERGRTDQSRSTNRYLKYIRYGNRTPNRDSNWKAFSAFGLNRSDWMFTIAFDYGEHDTKHPRLEERGPWRCRKDPFSTYRSGFEIRTYRLCQRIIMFHYFPDELGKAHYPVSSTTFSYDANFTATYLTKAQRIGHIMDQDGFHSKMFPPLDFEYSRFPTDAQLGELSAQEMDPSTLANIPAGVDGSSYQWIDLDGEGIPGVLISGDDGWFYKRNMSTSKRDFRTQEIEDCPSLGAIETIRSVPSICPSSGETTFTDVQGDGILDLVWMGNPTWGFFSRNTDSGTGWNGFQNFKSMPRISHDQTFKFIDLTGDGLPDILIFQECAFIWFASLGEDGYGDGSSTTPNTAENLPRLLFSDANHSMYLADMSGDGLTDLVRIQNGEVCFWPNIGYGQFDSKITLENVSWFEDDDSFNPKGIRLVDVDGSGTTDILYLGPKGIDSTVTFPSLSHLAFPAFELLTRISTPLLTFSFLENMMLIQSSVSQSVWKQPK